MIVLNNLFRVTKIYGAELQHKTKMCFFTIYYEFLWENAVDWKGDYFSVSNLFFIEIFARKTHELFLLSKNFRNTPKNIFLTLDEKCVSNIIS